MTPRPKIAIAAAGSAVAAAVAVLALSNGATGPAGATVPDTSVPGDPGASDTLRSITVTGHGTVTVVPDIANLFAGVQATADTAEEALDSVGTGSQALVDTLTALGVDEEDIQTSGLNLFPTYTDDGRTISGYQASTNVNITVRDVEEVGAIVDGLQGFVGEDLTLSGISFSYDDPEAVLGEARAAAVDNARARAAQYAEASDVEVGEIVRIIEGTMPDIAPLAREFAAQDDAAAGVAVEPGSQDLAADVTVVFEMG